MSVSLDVVVCIVRGRAHIPKASLMTLKWALVGFSQISIILRTIVVVKSKLSAKNRALGLSFKQWGAWEETVSVA
jgi:hypothetical protein